MFDKKVIFTVAAIHIAAVVYLGVAIYKNYPDINTDVKSEGADR